jgi:chromosome segregation ATPase
MSCFADICGTQSAQERAAEADLNRQMKQLRDDLKEANEKVKAAKKEREQAEQDTLAKEPKAVDVKAHVKAQNAMRRNVSESKEAITGGCFGWTQGQKDREKNIAAQVEKLKGELVTAQEKVSQMRKAAEVAQKDVAKAQKEVQKTKSKTSVTASSTPKSSQSEMVAEQTQSLNSMFAKDVKSFRTETPANQRQMKGAIVDLLNKLQSAENALQKEEDLKKQAQAETKQHEKTVQQLQSRVADQPFAFMSSGASNAWFRSQTPAQQREMKNELLQLLQDMEGLQVEKAEHEVVKDLSERKLSNLRHRTGSDDGAAKTNGGFAFKQ